MVDSYEFSQWMVLFFIEPPVERRIEMLLAELICLTANINRDPKKTTQPFPMTDFLKDYWEQGKDDLATKEGSLIESKNVFLSTLVKVSPKGVVKG